MKTAAAICVVGLLAGCATAIDQQVAGWPQDLQVRYFYLSEKDMVNFCTQAMPKWAKVFGGSPLACSNSNLDSHTCDIYLTKYTSKWVIDHELAHCKGGDHDGILQNYFDGWKRRQTK